MNATYDFTEQAALLTGAIVNCSSLGELVGLPGRAGSR